MIVLGLHHSTLRSSRYFISTKSKRRQRKRWRSQGTDSGPVVRLIVVRPDVVAPKDRADEEAASAELWRWSGLRFQVWKAKDSQIQNLYFQQSLNSFWHIKGRKITEEKNATFFLVKLTSHSNSLLLSLVFPIIHETGASFPTNRLSIAAVWSSFSRKVFHLQSCCLRQEFDPSTI